MSRRKSIGLLVVLVTLTGMAAVALRARPNNSLASEERTPGWIPIVPSETRSLPRASDPVQNIRFTIYPEGIVPRDMTVQKGLVSIVVEDRTRKTEGLMIERETGNGRIPVGRIKRGENFWRGRDQVRLVPGDYQVFDASNPTSRARLKVIP